MLERIARLTGLPSNAAHPSEQLAATFGGLIGIFIVLACTTWMLGPAAAIAIVPSMGASAVLVFAIPHSVFAQPWAVLVSHIVSAIVGVACYKLIPNPILAAAFAVALAIGAMHLTRSMHPPGGATALAAVIGGPAIHALGFNYVIFPVAINSLLMLLAAVLYNNLFPWRRYPLHRMPFITQPKQNNRATVDDAALHSAMSKLKVMIDIDPDELRTLLQDVLDTQHEQARKALPEVQLGRYYCNDKPGQQWSVRQIIDERRSNNPENDLVIYRIADGAGLNRTDCCTREEFSRWVGSELKPKAK